MDLLHDTIYRIMIREVNTFHVISNRKISKIIMENIRMVSHSHFWFFNQRCEWERLLAFYNWINIVKYSRFLLKH